MLLIALAGLPGSGKSGLARPLAQALPGQARCVDTRALKRRVG